MNPNFTSAATTDDFIRVTSATTTITKATATTTDSPFAVGYLTKDPYLPRLSNFVMLTV